MLVKFADDLEPRLREVAWRGFEYWNDVIGDTVFVDGGYTDVDSARAEPGVVLVRMAEDEDPPDPSPDGPRRCAFVWYGWPWPTDGCVAHTDVIYTHYCQDRGWPFMESVSRHEVGHVLGFQHSTVDGDLMFPKIGGERHPKRAAPRDVALAREWYNHGRH